MDVESGDSSGSGKVFNSPLIFILEIKALDNYFNVIFFEVL